MTAILTAELFARAIIAAATSFGDHPLVCFEGVGPTRYRRAPPAAALGVSLATDAKMIVTARVLGISPSAISVNKRRGKEAFGRAVEAAREAAVYHLRTQELKARAQPCADPAGAPAPLRIPAEMDEAWLPSDPRLEPAPVITPAPSPAPIRPAAKPAAKPTRAMPRGAKLVNLGEGVQRIVTQPVPEGVARHAKQQLDRGADLDFVADLFGFEPADLQAAVDSLSQGEAA